MVIFKKGGLAKYVKELCFHTRSPVHNRRLSVSVSNESDKYNKSCQTLESSMLKIMSGGVVVIPSKQHT